MSMTVVDTPQQLPDVMKLLAAGIPLTLLMDLVSAPVTDPWDGEA